LRTQTYVVGPLFCATLLVACPYALAGSSEIDIVGYWNQPGTGSQYNFQEDAVERQAGPTAVDYLGIPLNEEGRARALAYDGALLGVPEHQCMPHPSQYSFWGPANLRITADFNENLDIVAYHVGGTFRRADRTIWMDGRPHPPDFAPHTWAGFTTGHWEGNTLVTETTHLKWGWIRRNGVPASDQATVTTFYTRNGNVITIMWLVHDPLYLTEPYVKSVDFLEGSRVSLAQFEAPPVGQSAGVFFKCFAGEETLLKPHAIPAYLPWANPFLDELADQLNIPAEAVMGGAETALPEYQDKLRRAK